MRAGLLKEFITIYRYENVQSPSGQITRIKKLLLQLEHTD